MGNCIALPDPKPSSSLSSSWKLKLQPKSNKTEANSLPIDTPFTFPSPLPKWPLGSGFATGTIDIGGVTLAEITTYNKIWRTYEGGPDDLGITIYEPSPIPEGFSRLGCYSQQNNVPLFGATYVAKDIANDPANPTLKSPVDYTLIWSSQSLNIKQDSPVYLWQPTPPAGYSPVGNVVTTMPEKPSLDAIKCVRSDHTAQCEADELLWGLNATGISISSSMPVDRGVQAMGVGVGTFVAQVLGGNTSITPLYCLKNVSSNLPYMPNLLQVTTLIHTYSPWIYFHPDETYLPSKVSWFFTNGALLYKKGDMSNPVLINPDGSNLPQGGSNDGSYWIDLPKDDTAKQRVKKGDLSTAGAYLHIKPMLGGTYTDIAIWIFYPFNGPATAKIGFIKHVSLGRIGEHVGDWEHITLRISNFNGMLRSVFFAEHSGGQWIQASELEYQNGNKPVGYSSLHGHASYPKAGTVMQGNADIGIRNDCDKSNMVMDTSVGYEIIGTDYLGVVTLPWVNYMREWGPKIDYNIDVEIEEIARLLPGKLKTDFRKFIKSLPAEVLGEEGPTGPKAKRSWDGDEE